MSATTIKKGFLKTPKNLEKYHPVLFQFTVTLKRRVSLHRYSVFLTEL